MDEYSEETEPSAEESAAAEQEQAVADAWGDEGQATTDDRGREAADPEAQELAMAGAWCDVEGVDEFGEGDDSEMKDDGGSDDGGSDDGGPDDGGSDDGGPDDGGQSVDTDDFGKLLQDDNPARKLKELGVELSPAEDVTSPAVPDVRDPDDDGRARGRHR